MYVEEWGHSQDHVDDNNEPHSNEHFRRYQVWYQRATRSKLKGQWTQDDYADIASSDDDDTPYDQSTRLGTQVEIAPVLDRVVMFNLIAYFPIDINTTTYSKLSILLLVCRAKP